MISLALHDVGYSEIKTFILQVYIPHFNANGKLKVDEVKGSSMRENNQTT